MAYETGTATNYQDLLAKLITFLTTNSDLVTAGQEWSVLDTVAVTNGAVGDLSHLLRGPGLSGTDEVHVRIYSQGFTAGDSFGFGCQGFVSYNPSVHHGIQPGFSEYLGMALWNSTIPYWFIANGRRFIIVAKVSTVYTSLYAGFYLPYATPSEMPYPIIVAGSHEDAVAHRWSVADHNVGGFFDPSDGNAYLRHNDGTWLPFANYINGNGGSRQTLSDHCIYPYDIDLQLRENFDGSRPLIPCVLHSNYSGGNAYGELDGVFFTSGFGLGSEDTITESGDTHLVVQSVYRTTRLSYAAIKLV